MPIKNITVEIKIMIRIYMRIELLFCFIISRGEIKIEYISKG